MGVAFKQRGQGSHMKIQPRSQGFSPPRRGRAEKSPGNEVDEN